MMAQSDTAKITRSEQITFEGLKAQFLWIGTPAGTVLRTMQTPDQDAKPRIHRLKQDDRAKTKFRHEFKSGKKPVSVRGKFGPLAQSIRSGRVLFLIKLDAFGSAVDHGDNFSRKFWVPILL